MGEEQQQNNRPKWKDRYKELFPEIGRLQVYNDKISSGEKLEPLGPLLEEFMETVYNEGFHDGKQSNNTENDEGSPKI